MLMGLSPAQYVLGALEKVRPAEMEQALLLLPFSYALDLLGYLCYWLEKGLKVSVHHLLLWQAQKLGLWLICIQMTLHIASPLIH